MSDLNDLLSHVINKEPIEFSNTLSDIFQQKVQDALEVRKIEIAQSIYGNATPEDVEEEDFDVDLDIDDLDINLGDTTENDQEDN